MNTDAKAALNTYLPYLSDETLINATNGILDPVMNVINAERDEIMDKCSEVLVDRRDAEEPQDDGAGIIAEQIIISLDARINALAKSALIPGRYTTIDGLVNRRNILSNQLRSLDFEAEDETIMMEMHWTVALNTDRRNHAVIYHRHFGDK